MSLLLLFPAKSPFNGSATLAATSTLTAKAVAIFAASIQLQSSGTLQTKAVGIFITKATLTATSTLTAAGTSQEIFYGKAILLSTSTLTVKAYGFGAAPPPALKYTIEVHNSSGDLISILNNAYNKSYSERINEAPQIGFTLPADDDKKTDLIIPNEIWLRNYVSGDVVKKFIISKTNPAMDASGAWVEVEGNGYLQKLFYAYVDSYSPSGQTITTIVTALLAYQTLAPLITIGTIEITGTYSFGWSDTTVLACLNDILDTVGGYFEVTNAGVFNWWLTIGEDKGQQIRYRKNIISLSKDEDWGGLFTRLYAKGNGVDLTDYKPEYDAVDKNFDASYGYLSLQGYKCYDGWTGEGNALPADLEIFRGVADTYEIFDQVLSGYWNLGSQASDDNTATKADMTWFSDGYTRPLTGLFTIPRRCTGFRWFVSDRNITTGDPENKIDRIKIETTLGGTSWTTRVEGWNGAWYNDWGEFDFSSPVSITGLRIYIHSSADNGTSWVSVNEIQILSDYKNETALFVQGGNDATVRCAIGDYHAGDDYYISFTHAAYIKNNAAITLYNSDRGGRITFNSATDAFTLYKYAVAYLPSTILPPINYRSNIILLNEVDSINFSYEELQLGSIVSLIAEPLDIEDTIRIVGKSQSDLDNPATAAIEIESKTKTLADAFRTLWNRI